MKVSDVDLNQKKFLASLAALLAKMAIADGVVSSEESIKVDSIWNRLGLTIEQSEYCALSFKMAQNDGVSIGRYIKEFAATQFGVDSREFMYALLWDVACADSILQKNEKIILSEAPNKLGLPVDTYDIYYKRYILNERLAVDAEIEEQRAEYARKKSEAHRNANENVRYNFNWAHEWCCRPLDLDSAYKLFGCESSASNKELKHAYKIAAMRWHPDRLRVDGIPQELVDKANEKMSAYNAAWDIIKKHRKI